MALERMGTDYKYKSRGGGRRLQVGAGGERGNDGGGEGSKGGEEEFRVDSLQLTVSEKRNARAERITQRRRVRGDSLRRGEIVAFDRRSPPFPQKARKGWATLKVRWLRRWSRCGRGNKEGKSERRLRRGDRMKR
jgi:hypothetical protein